VRVTTLPANDFPRAPGGVILYLLEYPRIPVSRLNIWYKISDCEISQPGYLISVLFCCDIIRRLPVSLLGGWLRWTITRSQERRITYFLRNHYRLRVFHNNGDRYRYLWGCIKILVLKNIFLISKSDLPKTNPSNRPLSVLFSFLHESMACFSWLRA
jgi:hypothetical protein